MIKKNFLFNGTVLKSFVLAAVTLTVYAQTFNDPFHFDDTVTIVENRAVHYLPDWSRTFQEIAAFQPSRFVTNLTFALNYYFHRLDVFGYHLINVLIHVLNGFLVWEFGRRLCCLSCNFVPDVYSRKKSFAKKKANFQGSKETAGEIPAFLSALLFVVHPVNTQAVAYISQRSESLAALFYLSSVCCYLKARTSDFRRNIYFAGAVVCGLLATFSKETAVTLPLMIIVVELVFFSNNKVSRAEFPRTVVFALLTLAFLLAVPAAFHFQYLQKLFTPYYSQSHLGDVLTLPTYLMTQINVFAVFLKLTFVPIGLNLDHDFPMVRSIFEPVVFLNLCLLSAILYGAWRLRRKHPMLTFAVVWFFVTLSSNLVPRAHVFFEHKLYLALIGFIPAFAIGLSTFTKRSTYLTSFLMCVVFIFTALTCLRNRVWESEISLWENVRTQSPQKARVNLSLGTAYAENEDYDKAILFLTKAMGLMKDPYLPYLNRGAVYVKMKNDDLAVEDFNRALEINPQGLNAYINRGEVFARRKDYSSALADFQKAIAIDETFAPGYKMRGRIFEAMGEFPRALDDYNRALHWEPADGQTLAWRGFILAVLNRKEQALTDFNAAIRLDPQFPDAYTYRGMYWKDQGQTALAFKDFNRAIELNPSFALGLYQRASFYQSMGEGTEALKDVNRAIALDPNLDLSYALRALLQAQKKEFSAALEDFTKALGLNPEFVEVYINRGSLHLLMNQPQKAVDDFTQAIQLNPDVVSVYSKRAGAYGHLKKYELAVADLTKAINLNPKAASDYYNRSVIYKEFQKKDLALQDALKAKALGFPVSDQYVNDLR
ncbi:MAG: tetratricopeptide repeat protein [Candidatus Omnitrophica bacterium]|nr:tetratricopeptide repeat protein [Candidatus Omnitrophota bacterium]